MDKVAAEAGVTSAALYKHFRDKSELVRETLQFVLASQTPTTWGSLGSSIPASALPDIVAALASGQSAPIRRFTTLTTAASGDDPLLMAQVQNLNLRLAAAVALGIRDGQANGEVRADLDPELTARLILVLLAGLTDVATVDPALTSDTRWYEFVKWAVGNFLRPQPTA